MTKNSPPRAHQEHHRITRSGWLRAGVLGANDGLLSTASIIMGVVAAEATRSNILLAGVAGAVAGAMSMAAGEYVSVKSQADTESADKEMERRELEEHPENELAELIEIYRRRGLDDDLAKEVARQMTAFDALGTHLRDEIGIIEELSARPLQAALASATTFAVGAAIPLAIASLLPKETLLWSLPIVVIFTLVILGGLAAKTGGASITKGALRVCLWGSAAMGVTALIGKLFGVAL